MNRIGDQLRGDSQQALSMAGLKWRNSNQHLIDRICDHLSNGQSLDNSGLDYETLCDNSVFRD